MNIKKYLPVDYFNDLCMVFPMSDKNSFMAAVQFFTQGQK